MLYLYEPIFKKKIKWISEQICKPISEQITKNISVKSFRKNKTKKEDEKFWHKIWRTNQTTKLVTKGSTDKDEGSRGAETFYSFLFLLK